MRYRKRRSNIAGSNIGGSSAALLVDRWLDLENWED